MGAHNLWEASETSSQGWSRRNEVKTFPRLQRFVLASLLQSCDELNGWGTLTCQLFYPCISPCTRACQLLYPCVPPLFSLCVPPCIFTWSFYLCVPPLLLLAPSSAPCTIQRVIPLPSIPLYYVSHAFTLACHLSYPGDIPSILSVIPLHPCVSQVLYPSSRPQVNLMQH